MKIKKELKFNFTEENALNEEIIFDYDFVNFVSRKCIRVNDLQRWNDRVTGTLTGIGGAGYL